MPVPRFYTFHEIAEITHAPFRTVQDWYYSQSAGPGGVPLRGRKVGRRVIVSERDLLAFLGETVDVRP